MTRTALSRWLAAAALVAAGCLHGMAEVELAAAHERVPAAKGAVKTMAAPNDSVRVIVHVEHLAPAARVDPEATTYVVWGRPAGAADDLNLGELRVGEGRRGEMMAVVPFHGFEVFVTAERAADAQAPTGQPLLTARVRDE